MGQLAKLHAYPLRRHNENSFVFTTEQGNSYAIRFVRYWQEDVLPIYLGIDLEIYEIYFEVVKIQHKGYDARIQYTLMDTIIDFLSVNNRIGFFDIEREDGRGKELLRVYNIWLKMYEKATGKTGTMINQIVHNPGQSNSYIACIIHRDNQIVHEENAEELMTLALREIFPSGRIEAF